MIKKIIKIGSAREILEEHKDFFDKIKCGDKVEPLRILSFPTFEVYRKTLSKKRMQLLNVVRRNRPGSISELAKLLNRDNEDVSGDVKMLRMLHLIKQKELKVNFDKLVMEISV